MSIMEAWTRLVILGFIFTLAIYSSSGAPDCSKIGSSNNKHCQGNQECVPLGMESESIKDDQITASSYYTDGPILEPQDGRLNNAKYWARESGNAGPHWIQVDLRGDHIVSGIITQGGNLAYSEWVTELQVQYGESENSLEYIQENNQPKTFMANTDKSTPKTITFPENVVTRFIRIVPTAYEGWHSLRFELLGCPVGGEEPTTKKPTTKKPTSKPPTTTTKPPTTTTKPPTTTTKPPTTTTKPPTTTTKPPTTTTKPPTTTTKPPTTTTKPPTTTTKPPTTTAKPPTTTTKPPTTTAKPPTTTTKPPTTTTKPPTTTTKPPTTTTKTPTTTSKPPTTTAKPPTTTTKPPTTTTKPATTTTKPPTTTTKPATTATKPATTTTKPATTTTKAKPTTTASTKAKTTTISATSTVTNGQTTTTECTGSPLGMENGVIKDDQITASSQNTEGGLNLEAHDARLKHTEYWARADVNGPHWIQVDLQGDFIITKIVTQGGALRFEEWVTKLQVQYGESENSLEFIEENNQTKTFTANTDKITPKTIAFPEKVVARFIRIVTTECSGWCSLRFELLGCPVGATKTTAATNTHAPTAKRTTEAPKSTKGSKQDLDEEIDNTLKHIANLDTKTQVKEIEELTENIISKATTEENELKNEQNDTTQTKNDLNEFENVANLVSKIAAHVPKGERIVIDEAESGIVGSVENIQIEEDKASVEISLGSDKTNQKSLPSIVLPIDRIKKKGDTLDITVATLFTNKTRNSTAPFKNDEKSVVGSQEEEEVQSTYSVGSGVLSIQVVIEGSKESVAPEFSLPVQKNNKKNQQEIPVCVFWDPEEGYFSQEGVTTIEGDDDNVQCQANHTTSFAVLMQTSEVKISDRNLEILDAMTIILTPFSIIGLGLTIIVFHVAKLRKSGRNKIHFNLSFSLFFGQLIFLTAVDQNADYTACLMIAMVLHYFFLSSFGWMLIEGINLYYKIVKVSGESKLRRRYYNLVGWGIPIPIVLVTAAIRFTTYVSPDSCWLNRADGVIWAFAGPASVVICVNTALLVQVGCIIYNSLSAMKEINSTAGMRTSIIGTVLLTPILGITWAFGLLAIGEAAVIFQYCFVLGNCLQGVFIFAIFVLFNSEVRAAINLSRKKRRLVNTVIPCDLQKVSTGKRTLMSTSSDATEVSTLSEAETTCGDGGNSSNSSSNVALRETDRPLSTREVSVGHQ